MKAHKIAGLFLAVSLMVTGCGGGGSETSGAGGKSIELSASSGLPADNPASKAMDLMAKRVEELTNGSVTVKVFYDNQLGDPTTLVKNLQQGTVDIAATGDSYYAGVVPAIQVFELPFLFENYDQARVGVDGPVGEKVLAKFEGTGIKALNFWEIGFRHLTTNSTPVKTPEDLKGVKIRTLPAPVQVKTWELLGALPTPMDFSEVYTSLQQGVIDAQENPLNNITSAKFYEVQKHLSLTGHVYTPMLLAMSQMTWDKLSEEQRQAIITAGKEAQEHERQLISEGEAKDLELIEQSGVTIERNPDVAAFKAIAQGAYEVFTKDHGDELIKEIQGSK